MIGGNITASIQQQFGTSYNEIGEKIPNWSEVASLTGFLDLSSGDSKYTYNTKMQESTHIFICDYKPIDRNTDNKRCVINNVVYDILLIDNPMELNQQLEIYLKYLG